MVHRATPDPDESIQRFLDDRRLRHERRTRLERRRTDRRELDLPVEHERRTGRERRSGRDRRISDDRRLPPAAQFSWEETVAILAMIVDNDRIVACPRCSGNLLLGPHESHGGVETREVHCTGCRNSAVIVE